MKTQRFTKSIDECMSIIAGDDLFRLSVNEEPLYNESSVFALALEDATIIDPFLTDGRTRACFKN